MLHHGKSNRLDAVTSTSHQKTLKLRGYKILSKINEGGFSKVYLAEFSSPTQANTTKLAVKILAPRRDGPENYRKFLFRELNIMTQIDHPHIIHIHSILQIELKFYIFMRYAEQGDLFEFIFRYGPINEHQARVWTRQIALAIQYLHVLNIAHRDLKCENILITINYNVKIADFGFARYTVNSNEVPVASETYCGTLKYAAPELLQNVPYNPKPADLWSMGVVIFVILNKCMPFDDSNAKLLYANQIKRNYKYRTKIANNLTNEVKILIANLLEPDPVKRYLIEDVINSDWIALDERLTALSPSEFLALSKAYARRQILLESIVSNIRIEDTQSFIENNEHRLPSDIAEIKPFKESDNPRRSEVPALSFALNMQEHSQRIVKND